jgi:RNA polymerase sigma-70 factor (ECF subfamily)
MCTRERKEESDSILIAGLQQGDTGAFDKLFERYRRGILAYASGMLSDHALAEDVTQECFLKLAQHAAKIDPRRGVSGWLFRVARNLALDLLRRRKLETFPGDELLGRTGAGDGAAETRSPAGELERREDGERVTQLLATLPSRERELLVLRFYSGLTFREISTMVRRPLGTVLWQVRRSLEKLRKQARLHDER